MKYIQLIFKTFDQAYDECIKLDKSLLTVSSEEEQKMVYKELYENIEQPTAFWISLKRGQGAMGDKVLTFQGSFSNMFSEQAVFLAVSPQWRTATVFSNWQTTFFLDHGNITA